jgi:anti-sigma B factor antagonist
VGVERHGVAVVLAVSGDLDFVTTPSVRGSVLDVLAQRPALVVLDLLEIRFLGSAGLALLAEATHLRWPDTSLRVVAAGHAARTIQTTGLDSLVGLSPSVASALAAHQR